MESRKQFKFYRSYYEIAKEIEDKAEQAAYLMAICEYQFTGVEPELTGFSKFAFISQKHSLDKQVEGYIFATKNPEKEDTPQGIPTGDTPTPCPQGIPLEHTPTAIDNNKEIINNIKDNNVVNPKSDLPIDSRKELHKQRLKNFDTSCEKMLQFYNRIFSKQSRVVNDKTKAKLKKLLFDYDWKDIANAMIEVKNNKHHAESNYKWATLDFFTRPEKIEMYAFPSNAKPTYTGENAGLVNHVQNYYNKS